MNQLWHVRQYRPAYFSGFTNDAVRDVPYDKILDAPWFKNFKYDGFKEFKIEDYGAEKIISAHYENGEHWVAGFAIPNDSDKEAPDGGLLKDNWRYQPHDS